MHCFYLFLSLSLMSWIILVIAMFSHDVSVAFLSVLSLGSCALCTFGFACYENIYTWLNEQRKHN